MPVSQRIFECRSTQYFDPTYYYQGCHKRARDSRNSGMASWRLPHTYRCPRRDFVYLIWYRYRHLDIVIHSLAASLAVELAPSLYPHLVAAPTLPIHPSPMPSILINTPAMHPPQHLALSAQRPGSQPL
ncbi:hypothetical protein K458DRAFT_490465 [Lentithecium fluviatile CBS 122367]|uniref:Uncharacterized protein n=1 Tax=Lentithecium fluviatile CBS 122367 TaxID=1168545 RepID=A0A6G1IN72_9PLEO|nr:hypothetical protein K458DRAFT_490465 [Lentithecium fluviatile CBS 122367]